MRLVLALAALPAHAELPPGFGAARPLHAGAAGDSADDVDVRIASDGAGRWVAVWPSRATPGGDLDLWVARSTDQGLGWSAPVLLHAAFASDARDDGQPALASAGGGFVVVWRSALPGGGLGRDSEIRVARSTDHGVSWSAPAPLGAGPGALDLDRDPRVAGDGAGTWVAVWSRYDAGELERSDFDLVAVRSSDGGASWTPAAPIVANAASDARSDTAPRIASGGAGTWLVAWDLDDPRGEVDTDRDVAVARSTDHGASWSSPVLLNPDAGDGTRDDRDPELGSDGAGNWLAVWESNDPSEPNGLDFDIQVARSSDGGASWGPPAALNRDAAVDADADLDPQVVALGADAWLALWQSSHARAGGDQSFHVRSALSTDGGASWTPPESLPQGYAGNDYDPQLVRDVSGRLVTAFAHVGGLGADADILVGRGSAPFGPPAALEAGAASDTGEDLFPAVASNGAGTWVAVWQGRDPGGPLGSDPDIRVARASGDAASWSAPLPLHASALGDAATDAQPQVASDGASTWLVAWQANDPSGALGSDVDLRVVRSTDGGSSWSAPVPLNTNAAQDAGNDSAVQLAAGGGVWLALWQAGDPGGPLGADLDLRVARSTNGGVSWSAPAALDAGAASDARSDTAPQLAGDGAGTWVAVWQADDPGGPLGADLDVRVARSTNGGVSWSAPAALAGYAASDARTDLAPQIATDGDGHWIALWQADDPGGPLGADFDILVARSSNGGASWSTPAPLHADATSDTRSDGGARLASDGAGNWFAVWQVTDAGGAFGNDADLWIARSSDRGDSWTPPVPLDAHAIHDGGSDSQARVVSDDAGRWLALWVSTDPQGAALGPDSELLVARASGPDSDGDGLPDATELQRHGTDPADRDSENDGLADGEEILVHATDPHAADSDGDRLGDWQEVFVHGSRPTSVDGDADGLGDWQEVNVHGTDPADADSDGDALDDRSELELHGTDPLDDDTDGDDFDDGEELAWGSDPLDPLSFPSTPEVPGVALPGALTLAAGLALAARRALRGRRALALWLALATAGVAAAPARAIDPALCADDGVSEVPPFAPLGRDANQCLRIDPGNGAPPVLFQYETYHRKGISQSAASGTELPGTDVIDLRASAHGKCRTKKNGQYCSFLVWDVTLDNYLDPVTNNEDVWFTGKGEAMEYLLVKNTRFYNGWKCQGGGWNGPNGLACTAGDDSDAHSDGIQMRGQPVNGGWAVFQDSEIVNSHVTQLLVQATPDYLPFGSLVFQGVRFEQTNQPTGAAVNWIDDCLARGENQGACFGNRASVDYDARELWLIDVWGSTPFSGFGNIGKLVMVNGGCGPHGCNGHVGYSNGWPHPLTKDTQSGPGSCPNGPLATPSPWSGIGAVYCYTSIERALQDHAAPPFIRLSPTGWASPPSP